MLDWIIQYWVTVLFGLIVTFLGLFGKKIWAALKNSMKKYINKQCDEQYTNVQSAINDLCEENKKQNQEIKDIHSSLLTLQGISFKSYCRQLLRDDHQLTLEEFENCQEEYQAYHEFGGNGKGTMLYELVCKKAQETLIDK